jgi:hypothetical protein
MAAIDINRRDELGELVRELRVTARTIRAETIHERRATCERLAATLRDRLEAHADLDEPGLEALGIWTDALERADTIDVDLLQELLYGIDALVRVHLWRETGFPLEPPEPRGRADI